MVIIIKYFGWRAMYYLMGSFGITLAVTILALVKQQKKDEPEEKVLQMPMPDEE